MIRFGRPGAVQTEVPMPFVGFNAVNQKDLDALYGYINDGGDLLARKEDQTLLALCIFSEWHAGAIALLRSGRNVGADRPMRPRWDFGNDEEQTLPLYLLSNSYRVVDEARKNIEALRPATAVLGNDNVTRTR